MRQVDVRVMDPAVRYHASFRSLTEPWTDAQSAAMLIILSAFWGIVLYLGLNAF